MSKQKPLAPEKLVEKDVLEMCKQIGLDVDVIDSKATFSQASGRYRKSLAAPEGFSDLVGNDSNGCSVYIELKARGKLRTLRPAQFAFLERKVNQGCFACAVDSAGLLFEHYLAWRSQGREYLLEQLQKLN